MLSMACGIGDPEADGCGVVVGGDYFDRFASIWLTSKDIRESVNGAIHAGMFTKDERLADAKHFCDSLKGYRIYTRKESKFPIDSRMVAGYTECPWKTIIISTPASKNWLDTALVHELFHAAQRCSPPFPVDPNADPDHANWHRDGIYDAIQYANSRPIQ